MFCSGIIMNAGLAGRATVPASLYYPSEQSLSSFGKTKQTRSPFRFVESIVRIVRSPGEMAFGFTALIRIRVISTRAAREHFENLFTSAKLFPPRNLLVHSTGCHEDNRK